MFGSETVLVNAVYGKKKRRFHTLHERRDTMGYLEVGHTHTYTHTEWEGGEEKKKEATIQLRLE